MIWAPLPTEIKILFCQTQCFIWYNSSILSTAAGCMGVRSCILLWQCEMIYCTDDNVDQSQRFSAVPADYRATTFLETSSVHPLHTAIHFNFFFPNPDPKSLNFNSGTNLQKKHTAHWTWTLLMIPKPCSITFFCQCRLVSISFVLWVSDV